MGIRYLVCVALIWRCSDISSDTLLKISLQHNTISDVDMSQVAIFSFYPTEISMTQVINFVLSVHVCIHSRRCALFFLDEQDEEARL
jgi:hypothetical protein